MVSDGPRNVMPNMAIFRSPLHIFEALPDHTLSTLLMPKGNQVYAMTGAIHWSFSHRMQTRYAIADIHEQLTEKIIWEEGHRLCYSSILNHPAVNVSSVPLLCFCPSSSNSHPLLLFPAPALCTFFSPSILSLTVLFSFYAKFAITWTILSNWLIRNLSANYVILRITLVKVIDLHFIRVEL